MKKGTLLTMLAVTSVAATIAVIGTTNTKLQNVLKADTTVEFVTFTSASVYKSSYYTEKTSGGNYIGVCSNDSTALSQSISEGYLMNKTVDNNNFFLYTGFNESKNIYLPQNVVSVKVEGETPESFVSDGNSWIKISFLGQYYFESDSTSIKDFECGRTYSIDEAENYDSTQTYSCVKIAFYGQFAAKVTSLTIGYTCA